MPIWMMVTYLISFIFMFLFWLRGYYLFQSVKKAKRKKGINYHKTEDYRQRVELLFMAFMFSFVPVVNTVCAVVITCLYVWGEWL